MNSFIISILIISLLLNIYLVVKHKKDRKTIMDDYDLKIQQREQVLLSDKENKEQLLNIKTEHNKEISNLHDELINLISLIQIIKEIINITNKEERKRLFNLLIVVYFEEKTLNLTNDKIQLIDKTKNGVLLMELLKSLNIKL